MQDTFSIRYQESLSLADYDFFKILINSAYQGKLEAYSHAF
jgi:hypothetical protein